MKIVDHSDGSYEVVLRPDGSFVSRRVADGAIVGTVEARHNPSASISPSSSLSSSTSTSTSPSASASASSSPSAPPAERQTELVAVFLRAVNIWCKDINRVFRKLLMLIKKLIERTLNE